jgi:regulator of sigma E protease
MDIIFTVGSFLLLVGIIVIIHEGGHLLTALACKIKILEFSIGFGPTIVQRKFGKHNILFTLRLFPLGGYVKPLDKSALKEEEWNTYSEEDQKRSFMNSPRWKRALMVAGGPFSNFVLAFIIFFIASTFIGNKGLPPIIGEVIPNSITANSGIKPGDQISKIDNKEIKFFAEAYSKIVNSAINGDTLKVVTNKNTEHTLNFSSLDLTKLGDDMGLLIGVYFQGPIGDILIKRVIEGGVAEKIGLQAGDIIISVNGIETKDLNKILRTIRFLPGKEVDLKYLRNGIVTTQKTTLDSAFISGTQVGRLGVEFQTLNQEEYKLVQTGFIDGIQDSSSKVISSTWTTLVSIKKLVTGEISTKAISGPLSIADYSGKSAQRGLYTYLLMMASISIAIGVFNLLPIPMLDGGHLLQYFIEFIRQKDFTIKQLEHMQYVGIASMVGIFTFAMVNDINKYLSFLN